MPLPCIRDEIRCTAKCKARQSRCFNLAAYGMTVCKVHGARKKETILKGKDHPQYKHGKATQGARREYSQKMHDLRVLEDLGFKYGIMTGLRTVGRKPRSNE